MNENPAPEPHVPAVTWLGFVAMCVGMFMAILDIQIVASSLPDIQSGLGIPLDRLSWVQTAYLIAEVIAIPLTGWLGRLTISGDLTPILPLLALGATCHAGSHTTLGLGAFSLTMTGN